MTKLLLIGGYPKGYDVPFHKDTHSGQVLHKMLKSLRLENNVELVDLWNNKMEEEAGIISEPKKVFISVKHADGYLLVALGQHVYNCIDEAKLGLKIKYLPHPASRNKTSLYILLKGLENLSKGIED